jgi:hypothetical protein
MSSATENIFELNTAVERRFYPRVAPSALIYITFGQINDALLLNVSENGVLLSTPHELGCNFVGRLSMNLNGLARVIQVHARVLWSSESQKRAGIQFIDLSEHDREQIRKWQSLEMSRDPAEATKQRPTASASARSTTANGVETPGESLADKAVGSTVPINGLTAPGKDVQNEENFDEDARLADVGMGYQFPVHPEVRRRRRRARESALAVSLWAAVPIVALGIILLIRSGALPNPIAPSGTDRRDTGSVPAAGAELPDLKHPNASTTTTQGTAQVQSNDRLSSTRRNTDSERAPLDLPARVNYRTDRTAQSLGIAEANPATSANAKPGTASVQDSKRSDAPDSRLDQAPAGSASPQSVLPESPRTRTTPDRQEQRDAPQPELSATNALAANSATPNQSSDWNSANRSPKPAAGASYLARKLRSGPASIDTPEGEVITVRPEGHGTSFVTLPGARVLESGQMTLRIQRSVLMQGGPKWWPLRRSKKVALGELVSRVDPQAPENSIASDATVTVRAAVDEDGHVESVEALSGPPSLASGVAKAVQNWRYQPTLVDGKPVETQADVEVQFHAAARQTTKP